MSFAKAMIAALVMFSVGQAKPIINGHNIKAYIDSVKISIVVNGEKYETFSLSAQGIASPNGEVRLIHPKLKLGQDHFGIELDSRGIGAPIHYKAVTQVAERICAVMGRKPAVDAAGLLKTTAYQSPFQSLRIGISGANGILVFSATVSSGNQKVIDSIICE